MSIIRTAFPALAIALAAMLVICGTACYAGEAPPPTPLPEYLLPPTPTPSPGDYVIAAAGCEAVLDARDETTPALREALRLCDARRRNAEFVAWMDGGPYKTVDESLDAMGERGRRLRELGTVRVPRSPTPVERWKRQNPDVRVYVIGE